MTDPPSQRRLHRREELPGILGLSTEQVAQLERTGQLNPIRICGEERFDSKEVDALIETYRQIASRKKNTNVTQ